MARVVRSNRCDSPVEVDVPPGGGAYLNLAVIFQSALPPLKSHENGVCGRGII